MATDPLAWLDDELAGLEALGLRRRLATRAGPQTAAEIVLDGRRLVNFSSNDYLGLAASSLSKAVQEAVDQVGWGSGASPLVTGRGELHARLEEELAAFEKTEAALLFSSGYAANVGAIASLAGKGDVVFSDAKNHASIIDGCRVSGARIVVYPHRDASALESLLKQSREFRRRLIVTDALFSMDGDLAPLAELAELARSHEAMLMVDEAHATGVFGAAGRGVCEHLDVEDGVHIRVGTLSKALGSLGGFVAGRRSLIAWLANRARSYVFSTAPPEAMAAAGLEALRIVREEPHRRIELLQRAASLRDRLQRDGWNVGESQSQIIPLTIGDPQPTMQLSAALRERGFLAPGIRPPSVPEGESLLRLSLSYAHSPEQLEQLADAARNLRRVI
ncbi:MAG: 8-amino-7-oxononanoate synthase [Planctomycetes bacterium]|nr:8-amino-7-oxononanoate synthase [Planctomycetota bacterium]